MNKDLVKNNMKNMEHLIKSSISFGKKKTFKAIFQTNNFVGSDILFHIPFKKTNEYFTTKFFLCKEKSVKDMMLCECVF